MTSGDVAPTTNTFRVAESLRSEIIDGVIPPGTRLRAEAVADRYQVSRTPAREAFIMLEREGLLEIMPRRGAVVRSFDGNDVRDLYEVRALLEPLAARRAATRILAEDVVRLESLCDEQEKLGGDKADIPEHLRLNAEFHRVILEAAGSQRLGAALAAVEGLPTQFRRSFWADADHRAESLMCHRLLVTALRQGDTEYAETTMRMHILGAMAYLSTQTH